MLLLVNMTETIDFQTDLEFEKKKKRIEINLCMNVIVIQITESPLVTSRNEPFAFYSFTKCTCILY